MKKFMAVLLVLMLLLGTGTTAMAKPPQASPSKTSLPSYSTYEFKYQLPAYVVEDKDAVLGVTLKTLVLGQNGYDDAYIKFTSTGPGIATIAKNSNTYASGSTINTLDLAAQYNETTNWTLNFSKDGEYIIALTAYDSGDNQLAKKSQKIIVADGVFVYTLPDNIYADTEVSVNVGFITEQDFEDVHFTFAKTSGTGDITFKAQDSANTWFTFTNSGTWGLPGGFDITGPYSATTLWKLTFTEPGTYSITFKLVNETAGVLVTGSQKVIVESAYTDDDDEDEDEDEDNGGKGNTHGLMKALRSHLQNKTKGENPGRIQSMNRLMELLRNRGISQDELKEAIEEMENALSGDDDDDEDYKALGKMHHLKGIKYGTFVDGKKVIYDTEPILENGRTLVPFRKIAEALGAEVSYDSEKKQVTITKDDTTIVINIGKNTATINGNAVTLEAAAKIYKNRTLVPLRFLAEAFDATVDFYPEGALISIKKKNGR